MINAKHAVAAAQEFNRNGWLEMAETKLGDLVMSNASKGLREISVNLHDLIVGAENLEECAEMLKLLGSALNKTGYKNTITIGGTLIISW